jgi:methionyl-tRNA synthetase
MSRTYYATTPIYYISGSPHIGHAYTTIAADVLVRVARTRGPAFLLTGTDEHGQKVAEAAQKAGMSPQQFVDSLAPKWEELGPAFHARYDDFIRTTQPRHKSAVVKVFEQLRESGDIYLGKYEGWYCTNDETFWPESKLVDGRCPNPECRREVQWLSEDSWFFRLSKYQERLLAHFRAHPEWCRPQRSYNEMMAMLEEPLDDLSISRSNFDWGVAIPEGGVVYVWFDALLNYITAIGWEHQTEQFKTLWPASVHLIGKEIARFHTIIWPAILWALGLELPRLVFAHGWILAEGEKMSKSLGNVMDPYAMAEEFGADTVRYFLLREAPFGSDFSISYEKLRQRYTGDLGNDLGNLLRRSLAMLERYRSGLVPQPAQSPIAERFADIGERVQAHVSALQFREALEAVWEIVSTLNREVDDRKPWELHKQGREAELDVTLYVLCEGLRWLAHLLHPFMPEKASEMLRQLGLDGEPAGPWSEEIVWGKLAAGTQTAPADALFPRLEPQPA